MAGSVPKNSQICTCYGFFTECVIMTFARGSSFSVPRRTPLLYALRDPRNRLAIVLAGLFSLSLAIFIYLLKIYIVGSAPVYTPISSVKADVVVHPGMASSSGYLSVSEDINFTSGPSQFSTAFVRLFDVQSPGVSGSGAGLQYEMGLSLVDGREAPQNGLSRGDFYYTYPIKSGLGSFSEGPHRLSLDYIVRGTTVVRHSGRSHLSWNLFHPWPGYTGSVAGNFILPPSVQKSDPSIAAEIWERDEMVSKDRDVQVLVRDYRLMGDGIPRVMVSVQTTRSLKNWEYLRVVLSWPSR
jgi:hypothetical protein